MGDTGDTDETEPEPAGEEDASGPVKTYECTDCGYRQSETRQPSECPRCGGEMLDVGVSRE